MAKGRLVRNGCIVAICVAFLVCAGGLFFVNTVSAQQNKTIAADLKAIEAAGVRTSLQQLSRTPATERNAADLYRVAFDRSQIDQIRKFATAAGVVMQSRGASRRITAEQARAELKSAKSVDQLIAELTNRDYCNFNRDWGKGYSLLFPEFADMKSLANIQAAKARMLSEEGRHAEAVRAIRPVFQIASHASQDEVLIAMLVGIAIETIGFRELEMILDRANGNAAAVQEADKLLADLPPLPSLKRALEFEFVMVKDMLENPEVWREFVKQYQESSIEAEAIGRNAALRKTVEAKFVAHYRRLFTSWPKDPADYAGQSAILQKLDKDVQADQSWDGKLVSALFPVFSQAGQALVTAEARRRLAGAAVDLHQLPSAKWPLNTRQFGPTGVDPFTGLPMPIQKVGSGFKLWSVGQDLTDNSGKPYEPGSNWIGADLVWRYGVQRQP